MSITSNARVWWLRLMSISRVGVANAIINVNAFNSILKTPFDGNTMNLWFGCLYGVKNIKHNRNNIQLYFLFHPQIG